MVLEFVWCVVFVIPVVFIMITDIVSPVVLLQIMILLSQLSWDTTDFCRLCIRCRKYWIYIRYRYIVFPWIMQLIKCTFFFINSLCYFRGTSIIIIVVVVKTFQQNIYSIIRLNFCQKKKDCIYKIWKDKNQY